MSNLDSLIALIGDFEEGDRIPPDALLLAKTIGAAIIYGGFYTGTTVAGIVNDHGSCYDGKILWLDRQGFLPINDDEPATDECRKIARFDSAVKIRAIWRGVGIAWQYETSQEHRTFVIKEDNEWCRGIVFLLPETSTTGDTRGAAVVD